MDPSTYLDHLEGETISKKLLKKYGARGEEQHVASTCLCHNESASEKHNPPQRIADHPESHKRVAKILERLRETDLQSRCAILTEKDVEEIETDDLEGLVNGDYLSLLRELEESNQDQLYSFGGLFDSVYFTKETLQVARSAISLAYDATELVWNGLHANAALIVRPPGHHALRDAGNGFCVLNNVVLSAKHALKLGAQRILIVDFDVHHGQGVQRQFVDNDKVTYFSVHRYERGAFWPHLRESNYTFVGTGQGLGHTVNVPLSQIGATNADYMSIFWNVLYPLAMSLDPDMIFVSAGFDACYGDPLGEMNLTPDLYAHWMYHLRSLADGRVVMLLEGGYNHHNQALCVQRCIEALCGSTLAPLDAKSALSESCAADILNAVDVLKWHWPALNDGDPGVFDVRIKEMELARQRTIQALHEDTNDDSAVDFKEQDLLVGDRKRPKHLTSTELARLNFSRGREDTGNIEQHELPAFNRDDYALRRHTAKVGFAYDSSMTLHKSEFDSYENPKRISAVYEMLNGMGLVEKCKTIEGHEATEDELLRVHTAGHIEFVRNVTKSEHLSDSDLYCNEYTLNSALCAAGTLIKCVDEVLEGDVASAFALIRPPGHHASSKESKGFCFFNNIAIAARHAQQKHNVNRVLIVDWDVHFGDGTAEIFAEDDSVLYISLHRFAEGFYPHTPQAAVNYVGTGKGAGYTVNIPWNEEGHNDDDYLLAFSKIIMPIAYEFNPELVLVSSGFDACAGENVQLGDCNLSPYGFSRMIHLLGALANGKVIAALEGGYEIENLRLCSEAVLSTMVANAVIEAPVVAPYKPKSFNQKSLETIQSVINSHSSHWKCLKPFAVIADESQ